jgi:hypothetical protein
MDLVKIETVIEFMEKLCKIRLQLTNATLYFAEISKLLPRETPAKNKSISSMTPSY